MSALWALSAFLMTIAGGAFAFRYQRYLLFIMAFSAGLLIGVVFLDLIPEVTAVAARDALQVRGLMVTLIAGFVAIFLLEKLTIIHSEKQHDAPGHHHHVPDRTCKSRNAKGAGQLRNTVQRHPFPAVHGYRGRSLSA